MHLVMHVCIYDRMSIYVHMYMCVICVFSPLIDEAISQIMNSNRIYCTRRVVTTLEKSYRGEDSCKSKNKQN